MSASRPLGRTQGSRRVARPSLTRRILGGSLALVRLAGAPALARPVLSGGIAGAAVLFVIISANALYSQPGRHPKPMMATRAGSLGEAPAAVETAVNDGALMSVPLVLEVQNALARTGHYTAALDGRPGRGTEAAIRAFQAEHALRVDGQSSPLLLSQIHQIMAAAPGPSARPEEDGEGERYASVEEALATANDAGDAGAGSGAAVPAPASPDRDLVRRIQSGLADAEVAELKADGILGEQTRSAIRAFEALEGLDVTGEPSPRVLERLIEIGAAQ